MCVVHVSEHRYLFVQPIRNVLWSKSNGIPHDVSQIEKTAGRCLDEVPDSFQSMICELNNMTLSDDFALDPAGRVISDLIKRCILHCQVALLPVFLKTTKQPDHKAYVLMSLLEHDDVIIESMCEEIEEELFALLPSSKLLQKAAFTTPDIISHMNPRAIITVCCKLLKNTSRTDYFKSSVSKLLSHCIQKNAGNKSSEIVKTLVRTLHEEDCQLKEGSATILKYCESWRKDLVKKSLCDKDYSSFLQSVCVEMFAHPSNSSIFTLFAAFIGEGQSYDGNDQERSRITIATRCLISTCLNELERCESLHKEVKVDIFNLIAPLLLLRRIPHMFYKVIHSDAESELFLQSLSDVFAAKLGIDSNTLYNATEIGQERKLLAELVPRCLPFSGSPQCNDVKLNGFKRFCDPIFSTALDKIKRNTMQSTDWKKTKLSLYMCCHAIHLNLDGINVKDLQEIIVFIVTVFQIENNNDENFVELQTGCIDFLATCLESLCNSKLSSVKTSKVSVLKDKPKTTSVKNDLMKLFETAMFGIIYNETSASALLTLLGDSTAFSVTTRTCVLNSFTMAAKRCVQDKLTTLSDIIVAKLLVWAVGGPIDDNTRHPLCLAAFMQCLFILLTRSKSFNFLQQRTKTNLESNLRNLFQLCVEAVKFNGHQPFSFDKYSVSTMRIAAMKLLLGIITMDQTSSSSSSSTKFGFLAPGDISRAVSIIRGAANVDEDPNVRKLAIHLNMVLQ